MSSFKVPWRTCVLFLGLVAQVVLPASVAGSATYNVFHDGGTNQNVGVALSPSKIVLVYVSSSGMTPYAVVGEVNGSTVSFGTAVPLGSTGINYISVAALSDSAFVVAYRDTPMDLYGGAMAATVSGTTITLGSEVHFNSADTEFSQVIALSSSKIAVVYQDAGNWHRGTAVIGNVSGTSLSFGSEYVFNSATTGYISAASLRPLADKFVIAYSDGGDSEHGKAMGAVVSGTTISFGPAYTFFAGNTNEIVATGMSTGQFQIAYEDNATQYGMIVSGLILANTISYGTPVTFNAASTVLNHAGAVASISYPNFIVGCENDADSEARIRRGDATGNVITLEDTIGVNVPSASSFVTVFAVGNDAAVCWVDSSDGGKGKIWIVPLFADDFESGTTSAWSATVPIP